MNGRTVFSVAMMLTTWLFFFPPMASAQEQEEAWCTVGESADRASCLEGRCDLPEHRNVFLPELMPETTIRLRFNVFCEDANNQDTCAATEEEVLAQTSRLNQDFFDYGIQFVFPPNRQFHSDVRFRDFCPAGATCRCDPLKICDPDCTGSEESAMKTQYAVSPQSQLNVYVVNMYPRTTSGGTNVHGSSTFPWCPEATDALGGVMIDDDFFGGVQCGLAGDQPCQTLTHEIAHALGLWHTFHGNVSLQEPCPACREPATCTGDCTDNFCELVGDLACDTPAVPRLRDCQPPTTNDSCTAGSPPWPVNQDTNYMNLGDDGCWDHFTVRQGGRMHCLSCDHLAGWMDGVGTGACCVSDSTGSCFVTTADCCDKAGDTYLGDGTSCDGGCCTPDGTCNITASACCTDAGGMFGGVGTDCSEGACCFADGSCQNQVTDACCLDAGGVFAGPASNCTAGPFGRCCMPDGPCINDTIEPCCYAVGGWLWQEGQDCCTQPFCPQLAGPLSLSPCP